MKKILTPLIILICFLSTTNQVNARIKIDYASTTVETTGINRGQEEAEKYTTNIKNYSPEIKEEVSQEVGFWKGLFYIVVLIFATFFAR